MTATAAHPTRHDWTAAEIEAVFTLPLPDLIFRAQQVHREHHRADQVQGCVLLSVKTGGCPEDCAYCPQAARYNTGVDVHALMKVDEVIDAVDQLDQLYELALESLDLVGVAMLFYYVRVSRAQGEPPAVVRIGDEDRRLAAQLEEELHQLG